MTKGDVTDQKVTQKANTAYTIQIQTKPFAKKMTAMKAFKNKKVLMKVVN